jgi:hypothetical protein
MTQMNFRVSTATNFTFRFAKRFLTKDSKITQLEVLKWLLCDLFDTQDALIYKLLRIKRKTLQPTDE